MSLGETLLEMRKKKRLSQEEVAEKLNVTRQTVSKWETDQSTPDFDKIGPLCLLYEISADELLNGESKHRNELDIMEHDESNIRIKRAKGISLGILTFFIAVSWIVISIPFLKVDPVLATGIFLIICGIGTYFIVYTSMVYKAVKTKEEDKKNELIKQIESILGLITTIIYLILSFTTMAWHITWLIWIIYALIDEIIKLLFALGGIKNEK